MAKTFNQMVAQAIAEVPVINPAEAHQRMQEEPRTLVIDPCDAADIPATGMIPEAMNIADKARLYAESWRELKPGGLLAIYDIVAGEGEPLYIGVGLFAEKLFWNCIMPVQ